MKRILLFALAAIALATWPQSGFAHGRLWDRWAARHAQGLPWHAPYYETATGLPVALVVPPTAHMQTKWAWGVSQGTMTPIYHQFRKPYSGGADAGGGGLNGTPHWPYHSDQFGVYYVRGPW